MNINHSNFGRFLLVFTIPAITSCSVFSDTSNKYVVNGNGVEVTKSNQTASTTQVLAPPADAKKSKKSNKNKKQGKAVKNHNNVNAGKSAVTASDVAAVHREPLDVTTEQKGTDASATSEYIHPVSEFSISGEWTIYSVRGNIITGEERPYICFDLSADRLYGSNGCNVVNAAITLNAQNSLRIDNLATSMKSCADAPFEYLINLALSEVASYAGRQQGPVTYLDLKAANGSILMILRRHNMDFLNGPWAITSLNGIAMPAEGSEQAASIVVDIPQLRIHGTTGCNIFNGELFIDPDKVRSMQFLNITTTRMACAPDSRETEMLLALEAVESAKETSRDIVCLYDTEGNQIMTLKRIVYPMD